jgi:hypothetical protein
MLSEASLEEEGPNPGMVSASRLWEVLTEAGRAVAYDGQNPEDHT